MVGLLPLCATTVIEADVRTRFPQLAERLRSFLARHEEVSTTIAPITRAGVGDRRLLAVLSEEKLRRVLRYLLDENEFLSPHGIRALSRHHLEHPFTFEWGGTSWRVGYEPAESSLGLFGGNSNWRGPVWMPVNVMIVRALGQFYSFYGDDFRVECPTGSGNMLTLFEVSQEITHRLIATFRRGADGRRPVFGGSEILQRDPHWRDHILFYEYFHGDNGAGIGASHQTGWTGVIAYLIQIHSAVHGEQVLAAGLRGAVMAGDHARRPAARAERVHGGRRAAMSAAGGGRGPMMRTTPMSPAGALSMTPKQRERIRKLIQALPDRNREGVRAQGHRSR